MSEKDPTVEIFSVEAETVLEIPFADGGIRAGFPSPAQDYITDAIDLNKELIRHKETTFAARVNGNSMKDAGIFDGDILIVDKSIEPTDGCYVVACLNNEFTIKEYKSDKANNCAWLIPHNPNFSPIKVTENDDFTIWGVITSSIKRFLF